MKRHPLKPGLERSGSLPAGLRGGAGGILTMVIVLLAFATAAAQSPASAAARMQDANGHYESGRFAEALVAYEALAEGGVQHSALFYNLGSTYYKRGDLGRALLNFRRAQRLDPRDPDIAANLNFVRGLRRDQLDAADDGSLVGLVRTLENWLTLREAALLALVLWFVLAALATAVILRPAWRQPLRPALIIIGGLLLLGLIANGNRLYYERHFPPGVIVAEAVDVTSGPGPKELYLLEFNLHAGTEVLLLDGRPGWQRVGLPGDLQGWVPAGAVEAIVSLPVAN
jgi:hypothetical protein